MMLTCAKCGHKHPLSDEDVAFFHPRFFCLSCGDKLPFDVKEVELARLRANNDRDRRLTDVEGLPPQDTIRRVHKATEGGSGGGG
ncbi:MAG TPA: hypothetical protein VJB14_13165 [Planctomycetota bacterium]|nr:hypothetical protein [Planctomycetota bacterium]